MPVQGSAPTWHTSTRWQRPRGAPRAIDFCAGGGVLASGVTLEAFLSEPGSFDASDALDVATQFIKRCSPAMQRPTA